MMQLVSQIDTKLTNCKLIQIRGSYKKYSLFKLFLMTKYNPNFYIFNVLVQILNSPFKNNIYLMPKLEKLTVNQAGEWIQQKINKIQTIVRMKYIPLENFFKHDKTRLFRCHGQFSCYTCQKEWGSAQTLIQIGLSRFQPHSDYQDSEEEDHAAPYPCLHQFSMKGYRQKCINCLNYVKPKLNITNLDNLFLTIKNFLYCQVKDDSPRQYTRHINNSRGEHKTQLCEACAKGKCKLSSRRRNKPEGERKGKRKSRR